MPSCLLKLGLLSIIPATLAIPYQPSIYERPSHSNHVFFPGSAKSMYPVPSGYPLASRNLTYELPSSHSTVHPNYNPNHDTPGHCTPSETIYVTHTSKVTVTVHPEETSAATTGYSHETESYEMSLPDVTTSVQHPSSESMVSMKVKNLPSTSTSHSSRVPTVSSEMNSKRGVVYAKGSDDLANIFTGSSVSWAYNWEPNSDGLDGSFEFCPMLHSLMFLDQWESGVETALENGSRHLLAMNEPDIASQADMSPASAADAYKKYMNKFSLTRSGERVYLGAPAVTNGEVSDSGSPMGLHWLKEFMDACDGDCIIDFIVLHWYSEPEYAGTFKEHIRKAEAEFNLPIWVTEFGFVEGSYNEEQAMDFLDDVLPWMDENPSIERYSYFMVKEGNMVSGDSMTEVGELYANLS